MLVFIDDSGDPGFKLNKGSSDFFVIACVIFKDNLVAEEVALKMKKYRREIGWKDYREFKFNKTKKDYVREVLRRVAKYDFVIRAIVMDKAKIRSYELRNKQDSFYNYTIKEVLAKTDSLVKADIRLDGHSGRQYRKSAAAYFRREINAGSKKVSKVRFVDSHSNNLIQLADLVAGAINRSFQNDKTDSQDYLNIIKSRVEDIWRFK